jgi:type VI secretion system protein ImpL
MKVGVLAAAVVVWIGLAVLLGKLLKLHGADFWILVAGLALIGILAAAALWWFTRKKGGDAAEPMDEKDELEQLFREAEARLAKSRLGSGAKLSTLPVFFVMGERGSAKTTTVLQSGLDPELIAGQVYQDNAVVPTATANVWFARDAVLFESAASILDDGKRWVSAVRRLRPGRLASVSKSGQAPRAALVCFDIETFLRPGGADAAVASARRLHARLNEVSQNLGISFPVYVLFTRADRISFFADYTANFTNEEAAQVFGATLPVPPRDSKRIYAEEQSGRITDAFNTLYYSLSAKRPEILIREHDEGKLPGGYEFPREFRKTRDSLTRFLVELCRPSQLTSAPFLRGFYFTGVRPVLVSDATAAPGRSQPERPKFQPAEGATGMFRLGATPETAPAAAAQPAMGTRRVPQWVFLNHLFTDVLLADRDALAASGASTQTSMLRRVLLTAASIICVLLSIALLVSFFRNNALEGDVLSAAEGIGSGEAVGNDFPSADALLRLDRLRQSVATLADYENNGAPLGMRWGLYTGDRMIPWARRIYFQKFNLLLFASTKKNLTSILNGFPLSPGPTDDYKYGYDTLKSDLIVTSNHDRSTSGYLTPVLTNRWLAGRTLDATRLDLVRRQFDFYADQLREQNPFSSDNDSGMVEHARAYLAKFGGSERVYQAMLADAAKGNPAINFNSKIPNSAPFVVDSYDVPGAFTKRGWQTMQDDLKHPDRFFKGEEWVLGNQAASAIDMAKIALELQGKYLNDFLTQWRTYLKRATVVSYKNIPDASQKLKTLSSPQSPLLALFWLASQNTNVNNPDVTKAFKALYGVVPPAATDSYVNPANDPYMKALLTLQISLEQIAQQPGSPDPSVASQTLSNASNAKLATRQMAQSFGVDPVAHLEATVEKLLEDPITYVEGQLRGLGPAELNGKGKGLCGQLSTTLTKFPFNPASQTAATVADVNSAFKPKEGALWTFYDANLSKYLVRQGQQFVPDPAAPVKLAPSFVQFFNRAAAFSDAAYAGGAADPHFSYGLRPAFAGDLESVKLTIDGQTAELTAGAATKKFNWQASGPHGVQVTAKYAGGGEVPYASFDGAWAVFEWIADADNVHGSTLEWRLKTGKRNTSTLSPVRFDIDNPIFLKGYFTGMGCVSTIAKP